MTFTAPTAGARRGLGLSLLAFAVAAWSVGDPVDPTSTLALAAEFAGLLVLAGAIPAALVFALHVALPARLVLTPDGIAVRTILHRWQARRDQVAAIGRVEDGTGFRPLAITFHPGSRAPDFWSRRQRLRFGVDALVPQSLSAAHPDLDARLAAWHQS